MARLAVAIALAALAIGAAGMDARRGEVAPKSPLPGDAVSGQPTHSSACAAPEPYGEWSQADWDEWYKGWNRGLLSLASRRPIACG